MSASQLFATFLALLCSHSFLVLPTAIALAIIDKKPDLPFQHHLLAILAHQSLKHCPHEAESYHTTTPISQSFTTSISYA